MYSLIIMLLIIILIENILCLAPTYKEFMYALFAICSKCYIRRSSGAANLVLIYMFGNKINPYPSPLLNKVMAIPINSYVLYNWRHNG